MFKLIKAFLWTFQPNYNYYDLLCVTFEKYVKSWRARHLHWSLPDSGGVQNLERTNNVERPIFQNFEITNIKLEKNELFDYFIYEFIFYFYFFKLLEHSKYLIIFPNYKIFLDFLNCQISETLWFYK